MFDPEKVVVKVGNELAGVSGDVKAIVEAIAALSGALIAIGEEDLMTSGKDLKPFDSLIDRMNASFGNNATVDRFNAKHGDAFDGHFETAVAGLGSAAFNGYLWELGVLDTLYRLAPTNRDNENELTFTIFGFD